MNNEIRQLLHDHGAKLIRQRKHLIFRFPDGRVFTMPQSPSDHRWNLNALASLRRILGAERECHKNSSRPSKPGIDHRPQVQAQPVTIKPEWRTQLSQAMAWVQFRRWQRSRGGTGDRPW